MPRTTILQVTDSNGNVVYPDPSIPQAKPTEVISPQAAYIITDILAGNTNPKVNPFWGEWAVYDGRTRRPAAYKTGTTNDNRDVHAYGFLAPPKDPNAPGPRGRGLDGQQRQRAQHRHAVARLVGAALVADHARGQQGPARSRAGTSPSGLVDGVGRRVQRHEARAVHARRPSTELFIKGTEPKDTDDFHHAVDDRRGERPALAGRLRRAEEDGRRARLQQRRGDPASGGYYDRGWAEARARRARASGAVPKGTRTAYFYGSGFFPFGRSWGGIFAPTELCPIPAPPPLICGIPFFPDCPTDSPPPGQPTPKPGKTPKP